MNAGVNHTHGFLGAMPTVGPGGRGTFPLRLITGQTAAHDDQRVKRIGTMGKKEVHSPASHGMLCALSEPASVNDNKAPSQHPPKHPRPMTDGSYLLPPV